MTDKVPIERQLVELETTVDYRRSFLANGIARGQTDPSEAKGRVDALDACLESMRWLRDQAAVLKDPEVRAAMARARREIDADAAMALK